MTHDFSRLAWQELFLPNLRSQQTGKKDIFEIFEHN
jgi:hypothetical protein